jgi:hypothetical protein
MGEMQNLNLDVVPGDLSYGLPKPRTNLPLPHGQRSDDPKEEGR